MDLPKNRCSFVLVGKTGQRCWHFAGQSFELLEHGLVDFYPTASSLDQRSREIAIENVFATADHFVPLPPAGYRLKLSTVRSSPSEVMVSAKISLLTKAVTAAWKMVLLQLNSEE